MYRDIWERLSDEDRPIILYGTGNGADKVLDEMAKRGIAVQGIMASDDFVRGQVFRGFTVKRLDDHAKELSDPIIIIAFGSQRSEVIGNILSVAGRYTVLCADVPVYGDNVFDRDFYEENYNSLQQTRSILADEQSRKVFDGVVDFKLYGELSSLTEIFTGKDEAFSNILQLSSAESYLDSGAYRGDTIDEFLKYTDGHYRHITALEPDRRTYEKLREHIKDLTDIQAFNMGLWSADTDLIFNSSLGRGSSIDKCTARHNSTDRRKSSELTAVTCIDTLYKRRPLSYLKMDVEGAEEQAVIGGAQVIARDRPKLNIALYHRSEDIFRLPLLIHSIRPDYRLYLRQHPHIPAWDLNLYGV